MNGKNSDTRDEELASLVQSGDISKFGMLVERYEQKLLRYGKKFLSSKENIQDVVQEVFLKAYENIRSFDSSLKFSPWIYRIAHNAFVNILRKNSRNPLQFVDFDTFISHPIYEDPVIEEKERAEIRKFLDKGLEKLSPNYREIIILYYLEEMSYKEIADILRIPTSTVGIRLRRAREALKKHLPDAEKYYG